MIDALQQDDEIIQLQNQIINHIGTLKDDHHLDDKKWFQQLILNNNIDTETKEINLGIFYNFTFLDSIVTKLLNLDPRKIVSIDIIKRYIRELWSDNNQQQDFLEGHVLNNSQHCEYIERILRPSDNHNSVKSERNQHSSPNSVHAQLETHSHISNQCQKSDPTLTQNPTYMPDLTCNLQ